MTEIARTENGWAAGVAAWLAAMLVAGGTSLPGPAMFAAHTVAALALLLVALWRLRAGLPSPLATAAAVVAAAGLALVLL